VWSRARLAVALKAPVDPCFSYAENGFSFFPSRSHRTHHIKNCVLLIKVYVNLQICSNIKNPKIPTESKKECTKNPKKEGLKHKEITHYLYNTQAIISLNRYNGFSLFETPKKYFKIIIFAY